MSWTCERAAPSARTPDGDRPGRAVRPAPSAGVRALGAVLLAIVIWEAAASGARAQAGRNPGLLNVRDVQSTARVVIHGRADSLAFGLERDTLRSWLTSAVDTADFGRAAPVTGRSDSMAYLDVNLQVVPRTDSTFLGTAIFQVLRPGYVINVPAEEALYDVPVMQTAFTLEGTEEELRLQVQDLIGQYVRFSARRIRQHNPRAERPLLPADTSRLPPPDTGGVSPSDARRGTPPDTGAVSDTSAASERSPPPGG